MNFFIMPVIARLFYSLKLGKAKMGTICKRPLQVRLYGLVRIPRAAIVRQS